MNSIEFTTRPANHSDVAAITAMQWELAEYHGMDHESFRLTPDIVADSMDRQDAYYYVAQRRSPDELIGMMLCQRTIPSWHGISGVYIEDLYTREQYRHGLGVGTALLSAAARLALRFAADAGRPDAAYVRLDAERTLTDTVAFYRARGMHDGNRNFRAYGSAVVDLARGSRA